LSKLLCRLTLIW